MKLLYLNAGKNIEISNTQKYAILFSFWRRSRGSVDQIENYSSFLRMQDGYLLVHINKGRKFGDLLVNAYMIPQNY